MVRCFCHRIEEKYPSPINPEDLSKVKKEYTECIVNCAKSNEAELAITQEAEYYGFATLKFDKYAVELSQDQFYNPHSLQLFLGNWQKTVEIVNEIGNRNDIFHDEIDRLVKDKYGKSEASEIAYSAVAEILKQKKIRLWQSND